jgi:hypothetical protein
MRAAPFTLDKQGFELRTLPQVGDLYDRETIAERHDPQCRQLVASATGAGRVHVFDHTWRSDAAGRGVADKDLRHARRWAGTLVRPYGV